MLMRLDRMAAATAAREGTVRILLVGGFVLAVAGTGGLAQEGSCLSALEARIRAVEAVLGAMPRLDANCGQLRETLDAFVAAELALRKSDRAVRRACPAGAYVRGDSEGSVRFQFIAEAANKRLADCPQPTRK